MQRKATYLLIIMSDLSSLQQLNSNIIPYVNSETDRSEREGDNKQFVGNNFIIMQDNATPHVARRVNEYLDEVGVIRMD